MAIQKVGVRVVAENVKSATRDLTKFQKEVNNTGKSASKASKSTGGFGGAFGKLKGKMPGVTNALSSFNGTLGSATSALGSSTLAIGGATVAVGALAAATAVAAKQFVNLSQRGLQVQQTAQTFANVVEGDATKILEGLREQTRGTVSDFQLMQTTIASLAGTSKEFRSVVAPNIGRISDVTSRAAIAMGQSADVVTEKFFLGLRRQSKLLLDDIGVAVDAEKAYRDYAASIGVSTQALTENQKQAAFAAEAIRQLDQISAEAGGIGELQERLRTIPAIFKNIKDQAALVLLPIFEPIANVAIEVANLIKGAWQGVLPLFRSISDLVGNQLKMSFDVLKGVIKAVTLPFRALFLPVLQVMIASVSLAIDAIVALQKVIWDALGGLFGPINKEVDKGTKSVQETIRDFLVNAAGAMAQGGAMIIGAFAVGIMKGAKPVIQAVTFIAEIVADFLEGLSPPKKGPLSNIDKGGENVIKAWAGGMLKAVADPIEKVAAWVDNRLGAIGGFSLEQVEFRLSQLDAAILPFQNRVEIVKADFEAIAGFADPATRILERQRKALLEQLAAGENIAIESLRAIDRQVMAVNDLVDEQQNLVDQQELQLSLANAQQIQERTLLGIRKAQLGDTQQVSTQLKAQVKQAKKISDIAAGAGGAGGADAVQAGGGGADFGGGEAPDLLGGGIINELKGQLKGAITSGWNEGLDAVGFGEAQAGFKESQAELKGNLDRIAKSDVGQNILGAFESIPEELGKQVGKLGGIVDSVLDPIIGAGGTLIMKVSNAAASIRSAFGGVFSYLQTFAINMTEPITSALLSLNSFVTESFGVDFLSAFQSVSDSVTALFDVGSNFYTLFSEGGAFRAALLSGLNYINDNFVPGITKAMLKLTSWLRNLFSATGFFGSIFSSASGLFQSALTSAQDAATRFVSIVEDSFNAFFGDGGTISSTFSGLETAMKSTIPSIVTAGINAIGRPAAQGFYEIMDAAYNAVREVNKVTGTFDSLKNSLRSARDKAVWRDVTITGAQVGAVGQRGLTMVGESGPELLSLKKPTTVFPNAVTQALTKIASAPMMAGGNTTINNYYNSDNSRNMTFNARNASDAIVMRRSVMAGM